LEPFIIRKAFKPQPFKGQTGDQLGFYYHNNVKAWMTANLYQEFLRCWDQQLDQEIPLHKILLLQDNFSGHIIPEGLKNIRVENFAPNLTAHIQPMDQSIIRCFKAHYCAKYIEHAITCYDQGTTPSDIYNIDQLCAMCLANAAWWEVDTTTIQNCWHKSGILPNIDTTTVTTNPSIPISTLIHNAGYEEGPISHMEQQVNNALDGLVERGALQRCNQIDIEALLNPTDKMEHINETTNEEIFKAVMDAHEKRENIDIMGSDDVNDSSPIKHCPTPREALQAISLIINYDTILTPFSHSPTTDSAVDSLPELFLAYCTLTDSDDIMSDDDQVVLRGSDSDPVPLLTSYALSLGPSFLSRSRR
jgi:hypothetical protein